MASASSAPFVINYSQKVHQAPRNPSFPPNPPNTMSHYTCPPNAAEHWGTRLFENSNDLDVFARFDRDSGLTKLQDDTNADSADVVRYSIWAPKCSGATAAETVRKHLEGGLLATLAAKQVQSFTNPIKKKDCTFNGWTCVLLAACAMSHGSKALVSLPGSKGFIGVPDTYVDFVQAVFEFAFLQNDAVVQFRKALKDYRPGVAYDFRSKTKDQDRSLQLALGQTSAQATLCLLHLAGGLPLSQLESRSNRSDSKAISIIGPCTKADLRYVDDRCGSCGNQEAKLKCGRCKDQVYCNAACQKSDWVKHKGCCRTPEDAQYMFGENFYFMNTFRMA